MTELTEKEMLRAIYVGMFGIKEQVDDIQKNVKELRTDVRELQSEMAEVKEDIKNVQFVLENEIRTNICIIAEGHEDLLHVMKRAVSVNVHQEMFRIRLNVLESDVRKIRRGRKRDDRRVKNSL